MTQPVNEHASNAQSFSARLQELGIELPPVAAPVAAYVPAVRHGDVVYTSGQLPFVDGALVATGLVGERGADNVDSAASDTAAKTERAAEVSVEEAYDLARTCTLNALAAVDALVGLDNIKQILKVTGFVASAQGFGGHPAVLNGASELLKEIFGDAGVHARSAVGVAELPLNAPVEVELMVAV